MARLIHICPRYRPAIGGVELVFEHLCRHYAAAGHEVEVWTTDALTVRGLTRRGEPTAPASTDVLDGVRVRRFVPRCWPLQRVARTLAHALPGSTRWQATTCRWSPWVPGLDRACDSESGTVDVVHAAALPYSTLLHAATRLARRTGARLLISPFTHVPAPGDAGASMRRAYLSRLNVDLMASADVVCVQTVSEGTRLVAAGVPAARIRLTGVGVDIARVAGGDRDRQRGAWGIGPDAVVIGHLANKSRDKGTPDLLRVMPAVWARHPDVRVVLAGPAMASYGAHVAREPLDPRVTDLGMLGDAGVRDFMAAIDVFALPSRVESFGLAAMEAAATGSAVVAYAHGGPAELWRDGVDARLVPAGDLDALSTALAAVCGDATLRNALASAGAALADAQTWTRVFERAEDAYGIPGRCVA